MTDEKVLLDYYQQVGRITDLPLFVQSQGKMSIDLVVEIFKTVPTVRQVKDEAGDPLARIAECAEGRTTRSRCSPATGVRTMINEMELGFMGHCPTYRPSDIYAAAFDLWHAGKRQEGLRHVRPHLRLRQHGHDDHERLLSPAGSSRPMSNPATARAGAAAGRQQGGGRGGAAGPHLDDKGSRGAIDHYLKPYLKASAARNPRQLPMLNAICPAANSSAHPPLAPSPASSALANPARAAAAGGGSQARRPARPHDQGGQGLRARPPPDARVARRSSTASPAGPGRPPALYGGHTQIAAIVTTSGIEGNYTLDEHYFHPNWGTSGWLDYAKNACVGRSVLDLPRSPRNGCRRSAASVSFPTRPPSTIASGIFSARP